MQWKPSPYGLTGHLHFITEIFNQHNSSQTVTKQITIALKLHTVVYNINFKDINKDKTKHLA